MANLNPAVDITRSSYKAYKILHFGFTVAPILAGIDKFSNIMVDWTVYLSPMVSSMINGPTFMKIVGVVEIVAGILVAVRPKQGACIVALWLWCIIINLLTIPGFYDVALRDFGLSLGALALCFLAKEYATG